jgi:hypothetical protein
VDDVARFATGLPLGFLEPESWDSISKIAKIACPKLIAHGDADADSELVATIASFVAAR